MATNSELNQMFLNSLSNEMKLVVLTNIARHYGISNEEAEAELIDEEAENIMDYVQGMDRAGIYTIYKRFLQYKNRRA